MREPEQVFRCCKECGSAEQVSADTTRCPGCGAIYPLSAAPVQPVPPSELDEAIEAVRNYSPDAAPSPVLTQPSAEIKYRERLKKISFLIAGNDYALLAENPQIEESLTVYVENAIECEAERPVLPVLPEIKRLQAIIERERTKYAEVMTKIKHAVEQRDWLTEGRGPYEWNDDNWHKEFAAAGKEILEALTPLEKIARDLSDCPTIQLEVDAARAYSPAVSPRNKMNLEIDREDDGRWIAEWTNYPGCMAYGKTRGEAVRKATDLLFEVAGKHFGAAPAVAGRTQGDEVADLQKKLERAESGRRHTQDWYARHYGKLHDWARKILPEEYVNQFFSCIANGTWGTKDVGEPYMSVGAGMITPSGYIKFDSAQEQILHDQTTRAEEAELELAALRESAREAPSDEWLLNFSELWHKSQAFYSSGSAGREEVRTRTHRELGEVLQRTELSDELLIRCDRLRSASPEAPAAPDENGNNHAS